jgi:heme/copper-type cytochrome/quinol oxidase subunit 2
VTTAVFRPILSTREQGIGVGFQPKRERNNNPKLNYMYNIFSFITVALVIIVVGLTIYSIYKSDRAEGLKILEIIFILIIMLACIFFSVIAWDIIELFETGSGGL